MASMLQAVATALGVVVLLLVAAHPAAAAGRLSTTMFSSSLSVSAERIARAPAPRILQEVAAADCAALVPHCAECRLLPGAGQRAVCTRCDAGYVVKSSGRACWCAPGYYRDASGACAPCGQDHYCPGARSSAASGARRVPCAAGKGTATAFARSLRECVAKAGAAGSLGSSSATQQQRCPQGSYAAPNGCERCPAGMTTAAPGATKLADCVAAAGHYLPRGASAATGAGAVPCAAGTYKESVGNAACVDCPDGFTTAGGEAAATSAADCTYVLAGFGAPASAVLGVTAAAACPPGSYRAGDALYTPAGLPCAPCPAGLTTAEEGAASADACLAPPGFGVDAASAAVVQCPPGSYNEGWNRAPCRRCGGGAFATEGPGADGPDACFIPAGHGAAREAATGALVASPCGVGTYGRAGPTYGLEEVECTACPEHTTTNTTGATNPLACVVEPGHGYDDGEVVECDYGTYSAGGRQAACVACGVGYNTSRNGVATEADNAITGADGPEDCVVAAGWTPRQGGGLAPCSAGFYKSLLGASACVACPTGTTTTLVNGAAALSDCDACKPGFARAASATGGGVDPKAAAACVPCSSGTYSTGGGAACVACPKPAGYAGSMVTRPGASDPSQCLQEFVTDGLETYLEWDVLPMAADALTATAHATVEACQAACAASPACQYFSFYALRDPGSMCLLRDKVPYARVNVDDATRSFVLFEVKEGKYATYPAHPTDAASLGTKLNAHATRAAAETECKSSARCAGIKFVHTDAGNAPWRTFGGILWASAAGKVRATGDSVNPWLPLLP